jgi:hypothetical protein
LREEWNWKWWPGKKEVEVVAMRSGVEVMAMRSGVEEAGEELGEENWSWVSGGRKFSTTASEEFHR